MNNPRRNTIAEHHIKALLTFAAFTDPRTAAAGEDKLPRSRLRVDDVERGCRQRHSMRLASLIQLGRDNPNVALYVLPTHARCLAATRARQQQELAQIA